jgi:hypothetical protein
VIKSRRINAYKILVRKMEGYHMEDLGIDGNIILEWILRKYVVRVWTGYICLRKGTSGRIF